MTSTQVGELVVGKQLAATAYQFTNSAPRSAEPLNNPYSKWECGLKRYPRLPHRSWLSRAAQLGSALRNPRSSSAERCTALTKSTRQSYPPPWRGAPDPCRAGPGAMDRFLRVSDTSHALNTANPRAASECTRPLAVGAPRRTPHTGGFVLLK